jgi:DNA ligase-associated metallophosphoesterase
MSIDGSIRIDLAGEAVDLLPDRALYWPARRTLIVADVHLGKDAVFRRAGLAVPAGVLDTDLERLQKLIAASAAERLVVLGDLIHAAPQPHDPLLERMAEWRRQHSALAVEVIRGNHDRHAGDALDPYLHWRDEPAPDPPFLLCHEPRRVPGHHVLAGHLHPVFRLAGGGDYARLPAFHVGRGVTVLPAFGTFTGGHPVRIRRGERLFVTTGERVLKLPGRV